MRREPGRAGVAGVETVHIGEQDQQVGVHQRGHEGGDAVVVAEPDLLGGHRVVLVHDRDRAEVEQAAQRAVRVAVVRPPGHVVDGEEDLADGTAVPAERLGVRPHQQALSDARRRLLGGEVPRPGLEAQRRESGRDGARRDEDDLAPVRRRGRDSVDERVDPVPVQPAARSWSVTTSRP